MKTTQASPARRAGGSSGPAWWTAGSTRRAPGRSCSRVAAARRRGSLALLSHFHRLVSLDSATPPAVVESATALPPTLRAERRSGPRARVRAGREHVVRGEPRADRGMRVKVGQRRLRRQRAGGAGRAGGAFPAEVLMSNLLQEIEAQIAGAKAAAAKQNVGVIREIGDGVASIEGLADAMLNEMIDLGHGITGLALNLDETEVGVIILGDYTQLQEGDEVRAHRQAAAGAGGQGPARARGEHARRAAGRQRPDAGRRHLPGREDRARASSGASRSASRCRPASWPSTR